MTHSPTIGDWLVTLVVIVLAIALLTGCAEGIRIGGPPNLPQICPLPYQIAKVVYVNDPNAAAWCSARGARSSGCVLCTDSGSGITCEVHLDGAPNEVRETLLADEFMHVLGCTHVDTGPR